MKCELVVCVLVVIVCLSATRAGICYGLLRRAGGCKYAIKIGKQNVWDCSAIFKDNTAAAFVAICNSINCGL